MATYGDLQSRIIDETQREDLQTQIQACIQTAIAYYQQDSFYQSDTVASITPTQGVQSYTLPTDFVWMRNVFITFNGTRYPLRCVTYEFLLSEDDNTTDPVQGSPVDYALFGNSIYIFPRPDSSTSYSMMYDYVNAPAAPSADSDSDFWTNAAEAMVRNRAKFLLYTDVLGQPDLGAVFKARADEEHQQLREQSAMRKWTSSILTPRF